MKKPTIICRCAPFSRYAHFLIGILSFAFSNIAAQECVIIIQGYEQKDEYFASNGADALEEAMHNFPGGAKVTKLRPSGSNKSTKSGTDYSSRDDLLAKLKTALCDEACKDVLLAFIGHGEGGPNGLHSAPSSDIDGGMWVGEEGSPKHSTFIEAREIARLIDECKKEVKLLDNHCYASAMYNGIIKALKNKDLLKVAIASSKWDEESKFDYPDSQKSKGFYEFLREFLKDYYKIIGDPNVMEEIKKKADDLKKKAEADNAANEVERKKLRKEIEDKEKGLKDNNDAKDNLEKEIKDLEAEKEKIEEKIKDLTRMAELLDECQKLKNEERELSYQKQIDKISAVRKKYADELKKLPKNQRTKDKKAELDALENSEVEAIKNDFKLKKEENKKKQDVNTKAKEELAKKLKEEGLTVSIDCSKTNTARVEKALEEQKKALEEQKKKIEAKKGELKKIKDKIKTLGDEIRDLKEKLAAILDHSTLAPVMEFVLHYAFISAKANTTTSTAEEPQKPISDNEKVKLPDKKMKTIGLDDYVDGRVIKYRRYLNFYKIKDEKTGECVVVGYISDDLINGWPTQPIISKNCKEDCSVLEVAIKDGDKEIIIKLVKQPNGKYKAEVDGKEEKSHEFAFYVPFEPRGSRPEYLALVTTTFGGDPSDPTYFINGKPLEGTYDDATNMGQFIYQDNTFEIAFLNHGAIQFKGMDQSWTQQQERYFSLYDDAGNRIGEAGFIIEGEEAKGTLWIEDGQQLESIHGSFNTHTGQFELETKGINPAYLLEKNDTYGKEETLWHKTGMNGYHLMLPKVIPVPYIELINDNSSDMHPMQSFPQMSWNTIFDRLHPDVEESYYGTRISKKNHTTDEISYFDFAPDVNYWEDHEVTNNTDYTYCISSATSDNFMCDCSDIPNPPFYSYPVCFDWSHNKKDSIPEVAVNHFPWIPVIGGITGVGILTYIITKDKDNPTDCSFTASAQPTSSTCQLANGAIQVTINPQDNYTYQWSNGSTTPSLQNILPGNYSLTVTKAGTDCNRVVQVTVPNQDLSFDASLIATDAHCGIQNGNVQVNPNPAGSYTFQWSNGSTNASISNLSTGTYTVTISAGGNCTKTFSASVNELPAEFEISSATISSPCDQSEGTITLQINPTGDYSYLWSEGSTTSQLNGLSPGQYTVTVSINGTTCSKTTTINVDELPASFEITATTFSASCGLSDGSAMISVTPIGSYTYAWSNGNNGPQISGIAPGEYIVTVTISGTQCSKITTVTIDEIPAAFSLSIVTTPSDCGQSNGTGIISITPEGSYEISWSNGSTDAQAANLNAATYQVTVTLSGTTCSKDTSVTISERPPTFIISSTTTPSGCVNSTGSAIVTVDPAGDYSYIWSNGMTGPQINSIPAGDYIVTVTITGTNCIQTATITIGQSGVKFTGAITSFQANCGSMNGSSSIVITPSGEYTYLWSDQQTGPDAMQLSTGVYTVTVMDANGCSSTFSTMIEERPAEYISIISTSPANCDGGGDVVFTLITPGTGPLVLEVLGPEGTFFITLTLVPGTYHLSSFASVSPGQYSFTVHDQKIGQTCVDMNVATVVDQTPALTVNDDFYTTPGGIVVIQNVLDNDSGYQLQVTSVSNIIGGEVDFNANGEFSFFPEQGFSGNASFTYVVTDGCGNTTTAVVTIFVEEVNCKFTINFTTTPASCGLSDGNVFVEVNEPGNYSYFWETGVTGPELNDVQADSYTVTIVDNNLGCELEFTVPLTETPGEYISNIIVTQPSCGVIGEIQFTASTSSQNQLVMTINHPNGNNTFIVDPGTIVLSDYVQIEPGTYMIEVYDEGAGPNCIESFTVTLTMTSGIVIAVQNIDPPSSPSAMDGVAIITATTPGILPYTIFLNGLPFGTANQHTFAINGLGVGDYSVQVQDANSCFSNILQVHMPNPGFLVYFGTGMISYHQVQPEESEADYFIPTWSNALLGSVHYNIGKLNQEIRMSYSAIRTRQVTDITHGYAEILQMSTLKQMEWKRIQFSLDAGLGISTALSKNITAPNPFSPFWSLRASGSYRLSEWLNVDCHFSFRGRRTIENPTLDISVMMPILNRLKDPLPFSR